MKIENKNLFCSCCVEILIITPTCKLNYYNSMEWYDISTENEDNVIQKSQFQDILWKIKIMQFKNLSSKILRVYKYIIIELLLT